MSLACSMHTFEELAGQCDFNGDLCTFPDGTKKYLLFFALGSFPNIDSARISVSFDKNNTLIRITSEIYDIEKHQVKPGLIEGYIQTLNRDIDDNIIFAYEYSGSSIIVLAEYDIYARNHDVIAASNKFDAESLSNCFTRLIYVTNDMYPEFDKIQNY